MFSEKNCQRKRFLAKDEIKSLVDNCPEHINPIVITAINTGMRKGEILNLEWKNVDFNNKIIYIKDSKNSEQRELPMNELLTNTLMKCKMNGSSSSYVFCKGDGKSFGDVKKSFNRAVKLAKIQDFTFHDLRHTYASYLVMSGTDLLTVKELLGHKSIKMTERYSHLSPNHKKLAVDTLSNELSGILNGKTVSIMDTQGKSKKVV